MVKESYGVYGACNAPWNNMYITLRGKVSPCWKLPGYCDQWSKDRSLKDIWFGEMFESYRQALRNNIFLNRCQECKKEIDEGVWPLAKAYEKYPVDFFPSLMEIELSNQCNLECIMCSAELSSGIRKRQGLDPLPQIFDDSFLDQMSEFIPHLTELRINGGEPFAQKIVLDLCDMIAKIKPDLKINIATNGTVYNKRVQYILDNCNVHLNISIDSLIPSRYEEIRVNGDFSLLMKNFELFNRYHHERGKTISIMVNPMNNNWEEMIEFVKWTEIRDCNLWYNTILYPRELSIKHLPSYLLEVIYQTLKGKLEEVQGYKNYSVANHLVNSQIKNWLLDSKVEE